MFEMLFLSEWERNMVDKFFKFNYFVDIIEMMDVKFVVFYYYDVEMRDFFYFCLYEGVKYLGRVRGMIVGVEYVEVFEVVWRIWK